MGDAIAALAKRLSGWEAPSEGSVARTVDALASLQSGRTTAEGAAITRFDGFEGDVLGETLRRVAITRLTELDDIHRESCTTPGAVVVPTAVTLGAALRADEVSYARAVTIGYEAMVRLGLAIDGAHAVYRGLWPTCFCAPFAAAAVVAALLRLDAERTAHALALALTRAGGVTAGIEGEPLGRWLSVGDATRAGVTAALAARDGFVARVELGRVGASAARLLEERPLAIDEVSVKPLPIAKQCLAATVAATRSAPPRTGPIAVAVPEPYAAMVSQPGSRTSRLSRLSSAPWNIALALTNAARLHDIERAPAPSDSEVAALAALVRVSADQRLTTMYPKRFAAEVKIDGEEQLVADAPGDPPGNDGAAVGAKWAARAFDITPLLSADPVELDEVLRSSP